MATLEALLADPNAKFSDMLVSWSKVRSFAEAVQNTLLPALNTYQNVLEALEYLETEVDEYDEGTLNNMKTVMSNQTAIIDVAAELTTLNAEMEAALTATYEKILAKAPEDQAETVKVYDNSKIVNKLDKGYFNELKNTKRALEAENPQFNAQYRVDDNTVVYQAYENGTEFLMNFNDYKVLVHWKGQLYTIDGYGYIVLNLGN
jgi:hypothetical protein